MFTALPNHYTAVAHILIQPINVVPWPKLGFKNKRRAGFGVVILGFGQVLTSSLDPFTILWRPKQKHLKNPKKRN